MLGLQRARRFVTGFDDELFLNRHRQVFTYRQILYDAFHAVLFQIEPLGNAATYDGIQRVCDSLNLTAFFADLDNITRLNEVGRNVDLLTVHGEVIMPHKMTPLDTGIDKPHPVN